MTLHATRNGQRITIHGNLGLDLAVRDGQVSDFHVTDPGGLEHYRHFWGQLGRLIEEADAEREEENSLPGPD